MLPGLVSRRWAAAGTTGASTARTAWSGPAFEEAFIRRSAPETGQVRKFYRDVVVVNALWIFRRNPKAAIAFVEIAAAFHIFVVRSESPVVFAAWAAAALTFLELVARMHLLQAR